MPSHLVRDLAHLPCPLCPDSDGLELALRLELEAESQLVIANCPTCRRLYEVTPGGQLHLQAGERESLDLQVVRCPHCRSVGYAVIYSLPEPAESHLLLTCRDCQHTFCPEDDPISDRNQPLEGDERLEGDRASAQPRATESEILS